MADIFSWNIAGIKFINKVGTNQEIGPNTLPLITGVLPTDTLAVVFEKLNTYYTNTFTPGGSGAGNIIGTGSNGLTVGSNAANIIFVAQTTALPAPFAALPYSTPYVAGVSRFPGTTLGSVYPNGNVLAITNYMLKRVGDIITLTIIDDSGTNTFSHTILSGSNVAQYGRLLITFDGDPFATSPPATPGLAGQYIALTFGGTSSGLTASDFSSGINAYSYAIEDVSGADTTNSIPYQFYVDAPTVPSVSSANVTAVTTTGLYVPVYISGVPRLVANTPFTIVINIVSVVTEFYDPVQVASLTGTGIVAASYAATNGDITAMFAAPAVPYPVTLNSTLNATPAYSATAPITTYAYNSQRTQSTGTLAGSNVGTIAIDTLSIAANEASLRVNSGAGQYPTNPPTDIGDAFIVTTSLATAGNEELQLLGGLFQFPPAINYTGYAPTGPNYSALPIGSYAGFRWVTQNILASSLLHNPFINAVITLTDVNVNLATYITDYFGIGSGGTFIDMYWRATDSAFVGVTNWASALIAYFPPTGNPIPFVNGEPTYDASTGLSNTGSDIHVPIVFDNSSGGVTVPVGGFIQIRYGIQVGPYPSGGSAGPAITGFEFETTG